MELRKLPIHQSIVRTEKELFLGADRKLVVFLWVTVGSFLLALKWTWVSLSVCALIVGVGHPALIAACKYDPLWFRIVLRHIQYQAWYPAAAHPTTAPGKVEPSVPTVKEV
jgi:type IV secretory pathway TrbD component